VLRGMEDCTNRKINTLNGGACLGTLVRRSRFVFLSHLELALATEIKNLGHKSPNFDLAPLRRMIAYSS
jgi:hypothetical protein